MIDDNLHLLQFNSLQDIPGLCHGITTRGGGSSPRDFASLNLGYHVGDDPRRVSRNRRVLASALGYDKTRLVAAQQTHGVHLQIVTSSLAGRGALDWASALPATDALLTREQNLPLMVLVADCAPILMVDVRQKILAVVHAGWRGALGGIASKTLARMREPFYSRLRDIRVGIGPCIGPECYETGEEVAEAARLSAADAVSYHKEKPHLDLQLLIRRDLEQAGLRPQNIETMPTCTSCCNEIFYSHRRQHGAAGRFGLVAWWQ